jgi:inorganic triphosphatase YgiF
MDGAPGEIIETERKYEVPAGFRLPSLAGVPGVGEVTAPRRHRLTAVYYDTPGLALANAHITLRRRTGGTDAGWHLKLPAGEQSRREIHAPLGSGRAGVPPRLLALVAAQAGGQPVRPVARLRTGRTVRHLLGAGGEVLAEVADDRVTGSVPGAGGDGEGWRLVVTWREVEVELVTGTGALLEEAGARLCAAGARPSASPSKLALVLTAAGELPRR